MTANPHHGQDDTLQELIQAIVSDRAVLVAGAGVSQHAGYPGWSELLSMLESRAAAIDAMATQQIKETDPLVRAERLKSILGSEEYHSVLSDIFSDRQPTHHRDHETLVSIPFSDIFTTNYDRVLRHAHTAVHKEPPNYCHGGEQQELGELRRARRQKRWYVHLHGVVDQPDSIVLAQNDYDTLYLKSPPYTDFLGQFLISSSLIFIGFSLEDEDFKRMLNQAYGIAGRSKPRHFVILERPKRAELADAEAKAADRRAKYGISTVYFDNPHKDFQGLWELVSYIHDEITRLHQHKKRELKNLIVDLADDASRRDINDDQLFEKMAAVFNSMSLTISANVGHGHSTPIDKKIDQVFELVSSGYSSLAIERYEAIRADRTGEMSDRIQYRLDANIGNALYAQANYSEASKFYLKATEQYQESRDSKAIRILGHLLGGEFDIARHKAWELCEAEPEFTRAWSLWINSQRNGQSPQSVLAVVPEAIRGDAEVAYAIAGLFERAEQWSEQVEYARLAVRASPSWAVAHIKLGSAILQEQRLQVSFSAEDIVRAKNPAALEEAEQELTRGIDGLPGPGNASHRATALYNRSSVRRLLGNSQGALDDLHAAFSLDATEPVIVMAYALEAEGARECQRAIEALEAIDADDQDADQLAFVLAIVLRQRGHSGDLDRAHETVQDMASRLDRLQPPKLKSDVFRLLVQMRKQQGWHVVPIDYIQPPLRDVFTPLEAAALSAMAHLEVGEVQAAKEHVLEYVTLRDTTSTWFFDREVAIVAEKCELFASAVGLWQHVVGPSGVGVDSQRLAFCAYRAEHWKTALEVCRRAKAAGRSARMHVEVEVAVLCALRERSAAFEVIDAWLAAHTDDRQMRLRRAVMAIQDHRPHEVMYQPEELPSVEDVASGWEGRMLVDVLRRGPRPEAAAVAAYALYRRMPDDHEANAALLSCLFDVSASPLQFATPSAVGPSVAVSVRRMGEQPRWFYIEKNSPNTDKREYAPQHAFVQAMRGLVAGDKFEYNGHQYEVLGLQNLIVQRGQEVAEEYEERFPGGPVLRRILMPNIADEGVSLEEKLGEMYQLLQSQDKKRRYLEGMYKGDRLLVSTLARGYGRSTYEIVRYLTSDEALGVRVDDGNDKVWDEARDRAKTTSAVVLDETAIAGICVLGMASTMSSTDITYFVPQTILDNMRQLSIQVVNTREADGQIGIYNGQFFAREHSIDEIAIEVQRIESLIQFVEGVCETVGAEALLEIDDDIVQGLRSFIDESTLHAVAIASQRQIPLWTDDLGLRRLLARDMPSVRCIWTQALVEGLREKQVVGEEEAVRVQAGLIRHQYSFTRLSASSMAAVFEAEQFNSGTLVSRRLARVLAQTAMLNPVNQLIAALGIVQMFAVCPSRAKVKKFIEAVLAEMGDVRAKRFAEFVYRFPGIQHSYWRHVGNPRFVAGTEQPISRPRPVQIKFQPFRDRPGRMFKRLLRRWRSKDGEFRPR